MPQRDNQSQGPLLERALLVVVGPDLISKIDATATTQQKYPYRHLLCYF